MRHSEAPKPRLAHAARQCAVVLMVICCAQLACAVSSNIVAVSSRSYDNQNPAVAASVAAERLVVVWDGIIDGNRRILLRERIQGVWLPETLVDNEPAAANAYPSVDIDAAGNIHVAWIGSVGERSRVFYAFRIGDKFVNRGVVAPPDRPNDDCHAPSVKLDAYGKPWIVWNQGIGNEHRVYCLRPARGGDGLVLDNLTPCPNNYSVWPTLHFSPDPVVVWCSAENGDSSVAAQRFDSTTETWVPHSLPGLGKLPGKSGPFLFLTGGGKLAAIWHAEYEQTGRIFMAIDGDRTEGQGIVVDHQPEKYNQWVTGIGTSMSRTAIAWCSDDVTSGSQVIMSWGVTPPFDREWQLSSGNKDYCMYPRLVETALGICAVWQSYIVGGGDGHIYLREVPITQ